MCPNGSGLDLYFPLLSPSFSASASDLEDEGNPERVEFPPGNAITVPARAFVQQASFPLTIEDSIPFFATLNDIYRVMKMSL